jgi:hypothetical protein
MLVTCPSGLSFHARKWQIGDRRNLHDQQVVKQGLLMRKMLEAVDEGVENPGPYDFVTGKKVQWANVSLTDIVDALIAIRISTKPLLDYNEMCENCGAKIPISVDLRQLEKKPMSVTGKEHLTTGDPVPFKLPIIEIDKEDAEAANNADNYVDVKLRVLRGKDIPTITKHYKQDPKVMQEVQMVMHITEIIKTDGTKLSTFKELQDFYAGQEWTFQESLDEKIAELGGGMVTLVDMSCVRCNAEQEGTLPFGGDFFYPKKNRSISSMATL